MHFRNHFTQNMRNYDSNFAWYLKMNKMKILNSKDAPKAIDQYISGKRIAL
jgi:hypothetical protein